MKISIHALTKSATNVISNINKKTWISIHALTKSATELWAGYLRRKEISIHALTKSATLCQSFRHKLHGISIHALTKSATKITSKNPYDFSDFNPRTHKECDNKPKFSKATKSKFQSTHSQRVRLL